MSMTVAALHRALGKLIADGHARKPVVVNKPTFHSNLEDEGVTMLDLEGVTGPRWIYTADDDGGVKVNRDGTESGKRVVELYGCMKDEETL